jgi:hypothetical protein
MFLLSKHKHILQHGRLYYLLPVSLCRFSAPVRALTEYVHLVRLCFGDGSIPECNTCILVLVCTCILWLER